MTAEWSKDNRCLVKCLTVSRYIADTGAKYTCCSYAVIDDALTQDKLADCKIKSIFVKSLMSIVKCFDEQIQIGQKEGFLLSFLYGHPRYILLKWVYDILAGRIQDGAGKS